MKYIFIMLSMFFALSALADEEAKLVTKYNNWEVYTQTEDGQKVCFIASSPTNEVGNYKSRDDAYLWVRYVSANTSEISMTSGYKPKNETHPKIAIFTRKQFTDSKKKTMLDNAKQGKCKSEGSTDYSIDLIKKEMAWFEKDSDDKKLIELMKKSHTAVINTQSPKDTCSTDIYSLMGFTKAYNHMKSLCGS